MIVLFGGEGFVGRALSRRLAGGLAPLRVVDRRPSVGPAPPGVEHVTADLAEPASLARAVEGGDVLVHLASTSVPGTAGRDAPADAAANVAGGVALLEAAAAAEVGRVVFLSSGGAVYGRAEAIPTPETHPLRPLGAYGAAKAAMEAYLSAYAAERGLAATVLRLSNLYGPGQSPFAGQGAVAAFSHRLLTGQPIELWGDGGVVRDYLFIEDAVDAVVASLGWRDEGFAAWNVGSGEGTSTLQLIAALERAAGAVARIDHRPARAYDVPVSLPDCTRMRSRGWAPGASLDAGLALTVAAARRA